MRQAIVAVSLLGSLTIFALSVHLFDTLVMFLLFGILPGQERQLSANQMLTIYFAATAIVTLYGLRGATVSLTRMLRAKSQRAPRASQS